MKKLLFIAVLFTAVFVSCKKKDCPVLVPPVDLNGTTFKGSAIISGTITYNPFTIIFGNDGTCTVTFQGFPPFPGSWSKSPNSSIVYLFFDETATTRWKGQATLNATNNKLEGGTLTRVTPSLISGTFTVDKQ
jgi:hypothetical protein